LGNGDLQQMDDGITLDDLPPGLDIYTFLSVSKDATESEIRTAYRKQSLLYHPDKNPDPSAPRIFHQLKLARDILLSPSARSAYDNVQRAKAAKAARTAKYDDERRRMQKDLEDREREAKRRKFDLGRTAHGVEEEERIFKMEVERLKQESERLKRDRDQKMKEDVLREDEHVDSVDEEERTVKVKFKKGADRASLSAKVMEDIFSRYGRVENIIISKSALVVFASVSSATAALSQVMEDGGPAVELIKEVTSAAARSKRETSPKRRTILDDQPRSRDEHPPAPLFTAPTVNVPKFTFKPPASSQPSDDADYESITLLRMKKVAEQVAKEKISTAPL
jgi:DnaJ homolog subfamily C member 17